MMSEKKQIYLDFDEYIRQGEPSKREAAYEWSTAIGLQAVDGLKTSDYLNDLARRNIEGEITIDEVGHLLDAYYESKTVREADDDDKREADKASKNIKKILAVRTFDFSTNGYISIHRRIFDGVLLRAGKLRNYDITKKEWILRGDTVHYLNWEDLRRALDYDIEQEKAFDHTQLSLEEFVQHLSQFVSGIWQIHAFGEGNTRTTAVFTIQYLRTLGFNVENDLFAKHSWYFRNALVRANYSNYQQKITRNTSFLEKFFRNLLLGEHNELKNRYMVINPPEEWGLQSTPQEEEQDQYRISTEQVPNKLRTSYEPNGDDRSCLPLQEVPEQLRQLLMAVGKERMTLKQMMEKMELKHRPNFIENYVDPAIKDGFLRLLYPDKPNHPRQKYLLTVKGALLYNELVQDN